MLVPVLGDTEAEINKPTPSELSFRSETQFEVRSGRMGSWRFSPGGGKTQGVWRTEMWLGLGTDGEGRAILGWTPLRL